MLYVTLQLGGAVRAGFNLCGMMSADQCPCGVLQDEALADLKEAEQAVAAAKASLATAATVTAAQASEAGPSSGQARQRGRSRLCRRAPSKGACHPMHTHCARRTAHEVLGKASQQLPVGKAYWAIYYGQQWPGAPKGPLDKKTSVQEGS